MSRGKALAGVMGWPVAHSLSPLMHGTWLQRHGIDGAYVPFAVRPEALTEAVRGLPALGFRGVNVTIPHKEAVLPLLDSVSEGARRIGAVNTLTVDDYGRLHGENTDAPGFLASLKQACGGVVPQGPALLLGAGGAARAVAVALHDAGVGPVTLCNRSQDRAEALAAQVSGTAVVPWDQRDVALAGAGLVVNTTSLGMVGQLPLDLTMQALDPATVVVDLVYKPLQTPLLAAAEARGCTTVDGLGMLMHQGVPGFAAWFGVTPKVDEALRAVLVKALAEA